MNLIQYGLRRYLCNDIIMKSQDEIEESKDDVGRITFYVLREGVEL